LIIGSEAEGASEQSAQIGKCIYQNSNGWQNRIIERSSGWISVDV